MSKSFYITTTLPYVNATPHIGHALEFVRADVVARHKILNGFNVFFNTGTDEHGQKLLEAANKEGIVVQDYVDRNAETFKKLVISLGMHEQATFTRTTNPIHVRNAQKFWEIVKENGYIYKAEYKTKYCVGCELEKSDSELVNGACPDHPNLSIQLIEEENYFFKISALQDKLLSFFEKNPLFVLPDFRYNEAKQFVKRGLTDISISRLKEKMSWGVPVPGDEAHVMYVWFDALTNYITALGWPDDNESFEKFWVKGNPLQYCGQDNLRQQSIIWQAMLIAAGLPNTHQIIVNGFVLGEGGVKMSKTIGNVIDPFMLLEKYGKDALRLFLLKHIDPWNGSPVSLESFHTAYEADLVNGLGNLTSRLLNMTEKYVTEGIDVSSVTIPTEYNTFFEKYELHSVCHLIWEKVAEVDKGISETEPFKLVKTDPEKAIALLRSYVQELYAIALMLEPILPDTSMKIKEAISANKKPENPLFPRIENVVV